jgi:adenosylmethionine-8-amino-7-oxononanoate aminotransferase
MLHRAFDAHPRVGEIRGRGFFWGIELVEDRQSKASFDPKKRLHATIKREAMSRGLMVYPMGGTVDGHRGDHVLVAPPFIALESELELVVQRLSGAIDASIESLLFI